MVHSRAAGYDGAVAGFDEPSARSVLAAMQDRLARDPASALGLAGNPTAADLRAAFLQLTKQYHPVRFGRMAVDIQKLSNEVFLALRAAHDALAKTLRQTPTVPLATGRSPVPSALGSQVLAPAPPASPSLVPPAPPPSGARSSQPFSAKPARGPLPHVGHAGHAANDSGERPPVQRALTPPTGVKIPSPRPPVTQPASATRPIPHAPPSGQRATIVPASAAGNPQTAAVKDEAAALDLLQRQLWDQAKTVLHQLSARDPTSKRIRALMCYARGREAQHERRVDDARVELQDALELDPDLQLAKTALTELFTRRK
jgi:hypothetical protein